MALAYIDDTGIHLPDYPGYPDAFMDGMAFRSA